MNIRPEKEYVWSLLRQQGKSFMKQAIEDLARVEARKIEQELMYSHTAADIAKIFNVPREFLSTPKYNLNKKVLIL